MTFSNLNFQSCLPKMYRSKVALAVSVLLVLAVAIHAQTLTDLGATAPTPGANDISQLSTTGNQTAPDGLNYYTDNQTGHGSGEPGQTFKTGANSSGYLLTSVAIRTSGLGSYSGIGTAQPYYLHIYSVSGGNVTLLQTYTSANFIFNDGDWLQWSGLSVPLAANATYAWSFGKASSTTGWEALAVASGNPYAGGEMGLIPPGGGAITYGSSHGFDAVFDVGLILATQPNISSITVSPTNNVVAGTVVTFTASVSGALPLHYQWQFSSGGGYTNIAGANTNTLAFTAAITNTGSYELVLTNNYGAVTSAPITLTVTATTINQLTVSPTTNVFVGTVVTFAASVSGSPPLHFQWQGNTGGGYTNLPGANTNTFVLTAAIANTGSYQLVVTNSYGAVTSAPVTLTVTLDTTPPTVLRAINIGPTNVEVDFSKLLDAASATTVANYTLTNGTVISAASLSANGTTVLLTTAPLVYGSNYTLIINGVRDLAIPPNTIAANTRVSFTASSRGRMLLDAGWRFQLGDPVDVTTNVTYYPEISDLAKLDSTEVTGTSSETYMESIRVDPIATHAGENVSFVQTNYDDSAWRQLNLPHDWVVELPFNSSADGSHGYKPVGNSGFGINNIGWYRHTFTLPANDAGQALWLEFDGVYRNCLVWLNGHILGRNVSGYSSFYFDATPYANPGGTNVLVVRVDASRFEGWFYEGAGIYRHVWLTTENPVHVAEWGTFVATTSLVGSNATLTVQTDVTNQSGTATANGSLTSTIFDASNHAVATVTTAVSVPAGHDLVVTQTVAMANANLWSLNTPYMYNLATTVSNQSAVADIYNTPFGVRTVSIDSTNGVFINGQHVWIQGMCNHQDMAGVGSALPDRLQYYRIERLKEMGVNGYRSSHNEPTAELLDACDQLGMLVLDENRRIGTNAEPLGELSRQIRRDRNHPSVFMWSLGNEESLQGDSTIGTPIMQAMQNLAHSLDSTRLCTAAMSGGWGSGFSLVLDVTGFNYSLGSVDSYHSSHSTSNIIGTETSSQVTDRGIYTNDTVNGYVWGYDLNPVSWGETAEAWWQYYSARPWSSGGFCWTGFDYRGEPTPYGWPCINSHFGVIDMCGFPKDIFYYYQANWTLKPVLHLFPHWNWSTPGQPINVWAFGNCQAVELFTNGVSLGRQALNVQGHVEWDNVPFAPGTLEAIGYNNGGAVITNTVDTTGAPAKIALWPDRSAILADGRDVSVVTVAVLDAQGNVVPTASNTVTFAVTGGVIIGVGNGDPSSHEADKGSSQRSVFNGLAEVIVQSAGQPGSITLTATSTSLTSTNITITEGATLPPPAAPAGVTAAGGNAQVTVSWDIVPGATTYNLWRATAHGGPYTLIAGNIGGVNLGYTDKNPTNLTTYYYVVTANGNGTSVNSAEVSATPEAIVTGLTATASNGQIVLNWNGTPGANYNVKRSFVRGGPYTTLASSIAGTNCTDSSVASCQTYYYVVTITNAGNESLPSAEASVTLPGALPPQFTSADVGGPSPAGSASFCSGQYTLSGGGADIWGTADAFQFVYAYVPVSTNCDIRAQVLTVQNTSGNAKAGIMIRETFAANSRHAMADVEWSAGIEFITRTNTGASANSTVVSGGSAPSWVRLTRTNNTFTAYYSADGNTWTQIGSQVIPNMAVSAYAGLIVCSHEDGTLNTSLLANVSASFLTNVPPVISWVVPANNSTFIQPRTITLTASATDPNGTVTNVAFFNGPTLLGNVANGVGNQYSLTWSNAAIGSHTLSARATDNSGATNNSPATINIVVQPLTLTVSGTQTNGQFVLTFQGGNGQNYVLETSTNLTDWTPVWTNAPTDGVLTFTKDNATDQARFYRVSQ
jgi:beta-galactosidase